MALVRRSVAVGRAQVPVIPQQPAAAPTPAPVVPGQENAAAVPSRPARGWATASALGLAAVGAVGAWNINQMMAPSPFQIGDTMSTFGALFVFSAAVERVLEPFSRWMPGRTEQERYERAVADFENGVPGAMQAAAHYKAAVDSARASRGVLMWGIATFAATLLSASAGFYLLRMLAIDPGWNGIAPWADALVTGLVVGSGTKPLHDVITRFQRQSDLTQTPF
jgi:hypothetical protein